LASLGLILKDMLHDRSRMLLSITGLAVVIGCYFILVSLSEALVNALLTTTLSRNLIVIQNHLIDPTDAVLEPRVVQAAQELIPDSISQLSPLVFRHTRVEDQVVQLYASDQDDWQSIYHLALLSGAWPDGERQVVVGEGLAQANDWQAGKTVQIFGSEHTVSGIFRASGISYASVWMPIESFWSLFDTPRNYQALFVQAAPGVAPDAVLEKLQNDPRLTEEYAVYFEDNYARKNIRALQDMSSLMTIVGGIALLGIVFGVFNATTLSAVERSRDLGILLGLGFSQTRVRGMLWVRSILQALLAYSLGLGVTLVYLHAQQASAPFIILGVFFNLKITPLMAVTGLGWVIVLAFLGAWLSTRRMFNLKVVELLRAS
jgi:putative ABC transport system permease protein